MYIPNSSNFRRIILNEIHKIPYSRHLCYPKIISMERNIYSWPRVKKDAMENNSICMKCQQCTIEHQHPKSLLHTLPISKWKCEVVTRDFITKLPLHHNNMIFSWSWSIPLSKVAHLIHVKSTHKNNEIAKNIMREIFRLHELPY
jgi:hypothetical protein